MGKIVLWCKDCVEQKPTSISIWLEIKIPTDFVANLETPCRKHAKHAKKEESQEGGDSLTLE